MRAKLREVAAAAQDDPKKALLDSIGDISGIEVFHNLVLVATYIEPEMTAGGIYKPDRTLAENRFQGKASLVLKCGPMAFVDVPGARFGGTKVEPGDWVMARPSDGLELFTVDGSKSAGTSCRLFEDVNIKGRLSDPSLVY
jgi:hypothetical protein